MIVERINCTIVERIILHYIRCIAHKSQTISDDTITSNLILLSSHVVSDLTEDHNSLKPLATAFISQGESFPSNTQTPISLYPSKMDKNVNINDANLSLWS